MSIFVSFLAGLFKATVLDVPLPIIPLTLAMLAVFFTTLFASTRIFRASRAEAEVGPDGRTKRKGFLSSFAVFASCVGGALGMGNIIAGCVSVQLFGPGVLAWMLILGLLISASKFIEVLISCEPKYVLGSLANNSAKRFGGVSFSGPLLYVKDGFAPFLGIRLASVVTTIFSILFALGFASASIAQANQAVAVLNAGKLVGIVASSMIALMVLFFLLNDMTEIALFSVALVPLMLLVQVYICSRIILHSGESVSSVFSTIFSSAFSSSGKAPIQAVVAYAVQRMIFASDLGTGISGMLSSESNVKYRVKQALLSSFEPILTGLVVFMIGFAIVAAGGVNAKGSGVSIMMSFLKTKFDIFLFIASIFMFAITTIVTRSYCAVRALIFVAYGKFRTFFILAMFVCIAVSPMINFSDILTLIDVFLVLASTIHLVAILAIIWGKKGRRMEALLDTSDEI